MTPTTDLQKPFTEEQLKIWAALSKKYYLTRSLNAERGNYVAYHDPDIGDCLVAALDLAARVLELEAENASLREALNSIAFEHDEYYTGEDHVRAIWIARDAIKGEE